MQLPLPLTRDLVLIGGGHAHALVLRMWGMNPLPGVRLTLVNPSVTAPYTGMLPGHVAGHYALPDLLIDLERLSRFAGARMICEPATGLDRAGKFVTTASGRRLRYDVASIDIGISSAPETVEGFAEFGVAAKPMDRFAARWQGFVAAVAAGRARAQVAVIGGGLGGVELALAARHALRDQPDRKISLLEKETILAGQHPRLVSRLRAALDAAEIETVEGTGITRLTDGAVLLADGLEMPAALTIGAAGSQPWPWLAETGLTDAAGFIPVGHDLRTRDAAIFAAGDCAELTQSARPKAGVFAVRAAPVLFRNLRDALAENGRAAPFRPQSDYLKLVSLGAKTAAGEKRGLLLSGPAIWRWKDRIDRRFMEKFSALRPMQATAVPRLHAAGMDDLAGGQALSAGCGAKIGAGVLSEVLADLPATERADILTGPGDDAAILKGIDGQVQVFTTDHLRAFTDDPALMARIATVHALGDVWAMGAEPQAIAVNITLPPMAATLQRDAMGEIMAEITGLATAEGAAIVGGHSATGHELTIGLSVTGLARRPITLSGARPGDALILTKPLGTGVVMAAAMQLAAPGEVVRGALETMARPQGDAARLLAPVAHAMTDVTGFGLAGHAQEMARASKVRITLDLAKVPLLPGVLDLAENGLHSTLYGENLKQLPNLASPTDPRADLLFDPQTAGGLLASVSAKAAPGLLEEIRAHGFNAAIIGTVIEGPGDLTLA